MQYQDYCVPNRTDQASQKISYQTPLGCSALDCRYQRLFRELVKGQSVGTLFETLVVSYSNSILARCLQPGVYRGSTVSIGAGAAYPSVLAIK